MILINIFLTVFLLLLAFGGLNFVMRRLDERAGFYWPNVREKLEREPLPAAIYFGCRIVAVAIIFNAVVGRYIV
jgi:uncharacterized membrane protein YjfL (UPF0719 family)